MNIEADPDIDAMRLRLQEMEAEALKFKALQAATEPATDHDSKAEADSRSVHVANVDYSSTPEELQVHFTGCGLINRVTVVVDKWTSHPKGYFLIVSQAFR